MIHSFFKMVLLSVFILAGSSADAQFIKKLKNAASKGIENAAEKRMQIEAERFMARQLEKKLAGLYGDDGEPRPVNLDMEKMLGRLGEPVDTEDQYNFTGYFVMEMVTTDAKGKTSDPMEMTSLLGNSTDYTGMGLADPKRPDAETIMIFDMKNEASILLMDSEGEKSSFAFKLNNDDLMEMAEAQSEDDLENGEVTMEKTGNTKDILGYSCEEFHVKSEDGEGYYWVTEEPIAGFTSFWGANNPMNKNQSNEKYAQYFKDMPKGNFMEMNYTTSEGDNIDMKVLEIEENSPQTFLMSEFPNLMDSMEKPEQK